MDKYDTSKIKTSKRWPIWLRESAITKNKTIKKAFAAIGIPDEERNITATGVSVYNPKTNTQDFPTNLKIVFSTKPWDIATMSMRGVSSCQKWQENGYSHSKKLIGSIIDPYAGIIYLTDGKKTFYGERMLFRAVVRIVANKNNHNPQIYIERTYLGQGVAVHKLSINNLFPSFFSGRSLKIVVNNYSSIPFSSVVKKLPENKRSYRDSGMAYEDVPTFPKKLADIAASLKKLDKKKTKS